MKLTISSYKLLFFTFPLFIFSCEKENIAPSCEIFNPSNGVEYDIGEVITISVDAEDSDGDILKVRFYINEIGVGSASSFPYTYQWNTAEEKEGIQKVKVSAKDDDGALTEDEISILLNPGIEPPVAAFIASQTSVEEDQPVQFTDQSTNDPESWSWNFGDGKASTEENPSHVYESAGKYTVELTATNTAGSDSETKTDYIIVEQTGSAPVAAFIANKTTITEGVSIQFTDQSINEPTGWAWSFGDGNTSTQQNPSHVYSSAGTYTVGLTATNSIGSDSETKTGYITVEKAGSTPVAAFIASKTTITEGESVQFTDQSTNEPTSWSWNFGDGNTSAEQNPKHTFTVAGSFSVELTATNTMGSDSETKTNYITVVLAGSAPVAAFKADKTTITEGETVHFTDQSTNEPTSWAWDFGDGTSSTAQNPSHSYTSSGIYTVELVSTNAIGSDSETKTNYISVEQAGSAPVAAFVADNTSILEGESVQFTDQSSNEPKSWVWDFGDGGSSTSQNPMHTYSSEGMYTVTLTATNNIGSDSEIKTDYIDVGPQQTLPTVEITVDNYPTDITTTTAIMSATVTDDGGTEVTERGVCLVEYGSPYTPTINDLKFAEEGTGTGYYSFTITGLKPGIDYYFRAYAINSVGVSYSAIMLFGTQEIPNFTDSRDGNTYNTVRLGDQTWMAENLAYLPSVSPPDETSSDTPYYYVYGYDGNNTSQAKLNPNYEDYGVLYNWQAALISCPVGWHLPTDEEWKQLELFLGMPISDIDKIGYRGSNEGSKLAGKRELWYYSTVNIVMDPEFDQTGFGAIPGGSRNYSGFGSLEILGHYWTASEDNYSQAFERGFSMDLTEILRWVEQHKYQGFSVRCIKNE